MVSFFTFEYVIQLEFVVKSVDVLGCGVSRPDTLSEPPERAPSQWCPPVAGWRGRSLETSGQVGVVSQWDPGCSSSMAPFSPSELVWTCGSWDGRFSLTATCSFKTEQVLTSLSLLFWSVTWGHECAWAQPLLIAQPQIWAPPPGSLAHPPPPALLRSEPFFSGNQRAHSGLFGFYIEFCFC